jgi:hypothetical protein
MLYIQKPTPEEIEAEKTRTEQVVNEETTVSENATPTDTTYQEASSEITDVSSSDSLALEQLKNKLGMARKTRENIRPMEALKRAIMVHSPLVNCIGCRPETAIVLAGMPD